MHQARAPAGCMLVGPGASCSVRGPEDGGMADFRRRLVRTAGAGRRYPPLARVLATPEMQSWLSSNHPRKGLNSDTKLERSPWPAGDLVLRQTHAPWLVMARENESSYGSECRRVMRVRRRPRCSPDFVRSGFDTTTHGFQGRCSTLSYVLVRTAGAGRLQSRMKELNLPSL